MRGGLRGNIFHISVLFVGEELEAKEIYQYFRLHVCEEVFRRSCLYLICHVCVDCV